VLLSGEAMNAKMIPTRTDLFGDTLLRCEVCGEWVARLVSCACCLQMRCSRCYVEHQESA